MGGIYLRGDLLMFVCQCQDSIVYTINHQANTEYTQNYHQWHDLIRQEREDAGLNEEPVI